MQIAFITDWICRKDSKVLSSLNKLNFEFKIYIFFSNLNFILVLIIIYYYLLDALLCFLFLLLLIYFIIIFDIDLLVFYL